MPELTFSFDAPLEANHVSSEDIQAQLDEFRQMPWIKPDYKAATLDALRKVERYWRRYSPSALRQMSGNVLEQMRRVQPTVLCSGIVVANRWPVHQHSPTG
jgi:hypothetical protein